MESKLNLRAIQEYSDELAAIFLREVDDKKQAFSGKEILNLNQVKQVNLFILKEIFFSWLEQNEKIKSPYFDFQHPEVEKSLQDLMNLLSHHIHVSREDISELYSKAISDTILFYLVPDFFLTRFFQSLSVGLLTVENLKKLKVYLDLNKRMYEDFLNTIEKENIDVSDKNALLKCLSAITFEAEEKDIFDYFSSKKSLDIEQFLNIELEVKTTNTEAPANISGGRRFEFENEKMVHEKYIKDEPTVNDKLKSDKAPSIVDNMQKQKINNISRSISINQRFIFIKELFEGSLDNYEKALSKLDSLTSWEEANIFIEENIATVHNWDISKESVADFTEIIERRFR